MKDNPLIAVIFDYLGPYHVARLATTAFSNNIVAVELCAETLDYSWEKMANVRQFRRITLFERGAYDAIPNGTLVSRICTCLEELQPDVVAIPGWGYIPGIVALRWCERNKVPAIVMSESQEQDRSRWKMVECVKSSIVAGFSSAIVGGTSQKSYLQKMGMPLANIFTGYDVVDNDYFKNGADKARNDAVSLRMEYGLPEKYFLASSRFMTRKNLTTLIRAYAKYRNKIGQLAWKLVLLGDGSQRPELDILNNDLGLKDHVLMPGFKQYADLPVYYGLARAFVHTSYSEQWGLVVNEAMASGLPVLVSDRCGCVPDLVHDGVNGFIFPPDDVSLIAEFMCRLHGSDELCRRLGAEGQRIIAGWTPAHFALGIHEAARLALTLGPRDVSFLHKVLLLVLPALIPSRKEPVA